ncbi:class II fructose-bisphosphate aldolase [Patescibacteria group bacterium]|nr:class II fructose-bisphosphate aldolase [Patescibacteria group bacterium]
MRNLLNTLKWAESKGIALGHFNIAGFEQFKAVAETARSINLPVMIGVSEGEREYLGVKLVRDWVSSYNEEYGDKENDGGFWLFLNADHTHDLKKVKEAAESFFDEILFDGGKLPLEENIKQTKEAVNLIKSANSNILAEGEMGYIGSSSEVRSDIPEGAAIRPEDLTKPDEAFRFVEETNVDLFAPAVGNIHGMFSNVPDPGLNIEKIKEIKDTLRKIPGREVYLVLHGGSGNTEEDFLKAIDAGISVVHISTEIRVAWRKGLESGLKNNPNEVAPYKVMPESIEDMKEVIEKKLKLFAKIN